MTRVVESGGEKMETTVLKQKEKNVEKICLIKGVIL